MINDGYIYWDDKYNVGLWFGGIDDFWKFGKLIGCGGFWKDIFVMIGEVFDFYLMCGYDCKLL